MSGLHIRTLLILLLAAFTFDTLLFSDTQNAFAENLNHLLSSFETCHCTQPKPVDIIREVPKECPKQPWFAKHRAWHYPIKSSRCTMDACFNYSRCRNMSDLRIYVYETPPGLKYFARLNYTKWYTSDPENACLFFLFTETSNPYHDPLTPHPSLRAFWNGGLNHVLVSFADSWALSHLNETSIGNASLLRTDMHSSIYRPGFDVSITLPPMHRFHQFQSLKPWDRAFFLTFRGFRYVGPQDAPAVVRSYESFRNLHNGRDVIVALSCRHPIVQQMIQQNKTLGVHCDDDHAVFDRFSDYGALMNSTFGLAPAGIQPNSYRFIEVLSAGAIPVVITDNYVKPFDTMVQWHRCAVEFPTTEIGRVLETLTMMQQEEMEKRQRYCLRIYGSYLSSDEAMLGATIDSLKARFMGSLPRMMPSTEL